MKKYLSLLLIIFGSFHTIFCVNVIPTGWEEVVSNIPMKQISVGKKEYIWGIGKNKFLYQWNNDDKIWQGIDVPGAPQFKQVAVGADGTVWVLEQDGSMKKKEGDIWATVKGTMTQITVGKAGKVWGIDNEGLVFSYRSIQKDWKKIEDITLKNISVGGTGQPWGVDNDGKIYEYKKAQGKWKFEAVGGTLSQVAVGSSQRIWGIDSENKVYQWLPGWKVFPGILLTYITVGFDGTLWGIDPDGRVIKKA